MKRIKYFATQFIFTVSLITSCTLIDEDFIPKNDSCVFSIEKSINPNESTVFLNDTLQMDSSLYKFKIIADSLLIHSPFFQSKDSIETTAIRNSSSGTILKGTYKNVRVITEYAPSRNHMTITIPVTDGYIRYTAMAGSTGIPAGEIHFFYEGNDDYDDDFRAYIENGYARIEGRVKIYHSILGINYSTSVRSYIIYMDHPYAQVAEYL